MSDCEIHVDLGAVQPIDTIFVGHTNIADNSGIKVFRAGAFQGEGLEQLANGPLTQDTLARLAHGIYQMPAPVDCRYLRIQIDHYGAGPAVKVGSLLVGKRFEHVYEYKSGRRPIDLSERVDRSGGGFGFGFGAVKSSFRFTFSDLSDSELDALWDLVMRAGSHQPVVVIEGGINASPTAAQIHYCVFDRFEAFEREDPAATRWSLTVEDWV
ncbi:hypothetical protein QQS45_13870 [Alteriqipengyuania flavescens]|uniref:hypothetical protein n=1 Tax=Alteriqipengyuania flavescens TaxID=3053610 RepID=UPI0025B5CF27|nr:hypothetical protein [Alteriqipengyuania flavescens]WJY18669.1 hypothetical protein QQW98_13865 [Alteriqipengyuania flavescens]WJY24609.1 hypothetical protein QQS45_13870 [Alteriqipengyuania flavescens]